MKRYLLALVTVVGLGALASVLVSYGGAQGSPQDPTVIQAQNAGSTVYTGQGFVRENYTGGGCTPSNVNGVLTINCSGGGLPSGCTGTTGQITCSSFATSGSGQGGTIGLTQGTAPATTSGVVQL